MGGDSANYDTSALRFVRVLLIAAIAVYSIQYSIKAEWLSLYSFISFILFSIIVQILYPNHFFFSIWKLIEISVSFVAINVIVRGDYKSIDLLRKWTRTLLISNLCVAIVLPEISFSTLEGSVFSQQLRGSFFTMNPNDIGFWSALCLLTENNKFYKALLLISLILSQSRIYLVLVGIYFFINMTLYWRVIIITFGILLYGVLTDLVLDFFIRTENASELITLNGRTGFALIGLEAWMQSPWIGWGYYTGIRFLGDTGYGIPFYSNTFDNGIVDILVSSGIIGLVLYISSFYAICYDKRVKIFVVFLVVRFISGPGVSSFTLQYLLLVSLLHEGYSHRINRVQTSR